MAVAIGSSSIAPIGALRLVVKTIRKLLHHSRGDHRHISNARSSFGIAYLQASGRIASTSRPDLIDPIGQRVVRQFVSILLAPIGATDDLPVVITTGTKLQLKSTSPDRGDR